MKNKIHEYFYYSRLERNGILVLSFLCVIFFLFPNIKQLNSDSSVTDFSVFQKEIEAFDDVEIVEFEKNEVIKQSLFAFDPNTASDSQLLELGISKKVANTLINFRNKGGRFFKKEDLKKIYGFSEEEYTRLENYIEINQSKKEQPTISEQPLNAPKLPIELFEFDPNTVTRQELEQLGFPRRAANNLLKFRAKGGVLRTKEELSKIYGIEGAFFEKIFPYIEIDAAPKTIIPEKEKNVEPTYTAKNQNETEHYVVEINSASENEWQKLKGIGPFYASRITAFREKLGGFYNINQIKETYGLPDSTFQSILPYLKLENPPKQIDLNTITENELAAHPYLSFKQAKVVINYRQQHGDFNNLEELNNIIPLDSKLIEKLKPYLFVQ